MAYMDYMDPDVRCPQQAVKLNDSLTLGGHHSQSDGKT